jgi:kinesin family protein 1
LEEAKKNEGEHIGQFVDISLPHLVVLNEDPQLSHKLKYQLVELPIYVGRKHGNPPPQITLSGIGIKQNHAIFEKQGEDIILKPNDKDAREYIFINGKNIPQEGQIIKTKDRIIFGTNTIFIYMKSSNGEDIFSIDWETAQMELQKEIE